MPQVTVVSATRTWVANIVLLTKPEQLRTDLKVRYKGFDIPSAFVVGYGLDYAERYRNLPFVATLKPEVYQTRGRA
jgi:hypoxanthine phosphoribosyltransferase